MIEFELSQSIFFSLCRSPVCASLCSCMGVKESYYVSVCTRLAPLNTYVFIMASIIFLYRSNCDAETSHVLRQHYQRPYFLPDTAESTHADWIFMGTPGYGAHMHVSVDMVYSWIFIQKSLIIRVHSRGLPRS